MPAAVCQRSRPGGSDDQNIGRFHAGVRSFHNFDFGAEDRLSGIVRLRIVHHNAIAFAGELRRNGDTLAFLNDRSVRLVGQTQYSDCAARQQAAHQADDTIDLPLVYGIGCLRNIGASTDSARHRGEGGVVTWKAWAAVAERGGQIFAANPCVAANGFQDDTCVGIARTDRIPRGKPIFAKEIFAVTYELTVIFVISAFTKFIRWMCGNCRRCGRRSTPGGRRREHRTHR